jgi:hypothetical protein
VRGGKVRNVNPTFQRTLAVTAYRMSGSAIKHVLTIARHESAKMTKLCDRTSDRIDLDEIEKIQI